MEWITANQEWLFSGLGIFIIAGVWKWFIANNDKLKNQQVQKGGKNSTNIQVGGNLDLSNNNNSTKDDKPNGE